MKLLRTLAALLLLAVMALPAAADSKVVERSAKKAPQWLGAPADGYLVVTVEAPSLAEAQRMAVNEITERIIQAVASNVVVEQRSSASETVTGGNVVSSDDTYARSSSIRSANFPFLSGISLSKAADIYWVKLQDKKTKVERYEYSVRYPFTRLELQTLQADFKKLDDEKMARLEELESTADALTAVEQIGAGLADLDGLAAYFFDAPRVARVKALRARYNDLYKSLALTGSIVAPGRIECGVTLQGRPVSCGFTPTVKANCANNIGLIPRDGRYVITYQTADCLADEDNWIDVDVRVRGKSLAHRFVLADAAAGAGAAEKFSVVPCGTLSVMADSIDAAGARVGALRVTLSLDNRGDTDFGVKALRVDLPGIATPLEVDDIDAIFTSRGIVKLRCRVGGYVRVVPRRGNSASGTVELANPLTGRVESVRFTLPVAVNWQ